MADSHSHIIREVDPQPVRYLLRAPRGEPFTVRPVWLAQPLPRRGAWTSHDASVLVADHPSQAVFHVLAKARIAHELSHLRTLRGFLGVPLGHPRPILHRPATGGGVTSQLPRNGRRIPPQSASDLTHPHLLGIQDGDLLTLFKRQIPPRGLIQS